MQYRVLVTFTTLVCKYHKGEVIAEGDIRKSDLEIALAKKYIRAIKS